jgi:hypothetical protein
MLSLPQEMYRQLIDRSMCEFKTLWKRLLWPNLGYYSLMFLQGREEKNVKLYSGWPISEPKMKAWASVTGSANVKCLTANFNPLVKQPEIPSRLPLANACHCAPSINSFVQTPCPHILPRKDQLHYDSLLMSSFFSSCHISFFPIKFLYVS